MGTSGIKKKELYAEMKQVAPTLYVWRIG
jgi:hypothetical protein